MIKLKDIIKEIETDQEPEKKLMFRWTTPLGVPDILVNIIHQILSQVMRKVGSNNQHEIENYVQTVTIDEENTGIWNPSSKLLLIYNNHDKTWQVRFATEMHAKYISDRELNNIIEHWMR